MTQSWLAPDHPDAVAGGEPRLPKPPGVFRRFWARHPRLTDGLIAGVYGVPTIVSVIITALQYGLPLWLTLLQLAVVLGAAAAMLLVRRTRPWLVLALGWLACLVSAASGSLEILAILIALYALAVYASTRAAWIGFGVSVAVGAMGSYLATWLRDTLIVEPFDFEPLGSSIAFGLFMLIATLIGVTVGNRRRYLDALIARAHDLARERDQQAELAAAQERSRIAREMHDIVSHGLTVMITLAEGSAATAGRDPERAADAMRHVADAGRDALGEMRRMLGVLTGPAGAAADRSPQPDVAAVPALVDGFREAGLPVRLTTSGAAVTEHTLQLTVYRVVQEGLTNALRHATGAQHVDVRIERRDDDVVVTVEDDARHTAPQMVGAGRGLAGLRERVALYGGTVEAEPLPGGGWRLRVTLHAASDRIEEDA
ncbi:histidine kinase [Agromyces sp. SYSU K20354]|uniref:sensor histidine kinase n=1 Tax=Agromyces cavernae TaxID=2898659 RepID=UPI001E62E69F|nr:histidine kinase [Agromyces cavernae]MCD2442371.1 histidine kinase [Agromyces cavernae]